MAKPTWLGRNEMESRQECRNAFAPIFSCLPAFLIYKPWNEKLLMRKAGNQEFFGQPRLYWSDKQTERTKKLARMATTLHSTQKK